MFASPPSFSKVQEIRERLAARRLSPQEEQLERSRARQRLYKAGKLREEGNAAVREERPGVEPGLRTGD